MKLAEARDLSFALIRRDLLSAGLLHLLDTASPDGDAGKFQLAGKPARLVPHRDGFYLNVNLDWFKGSDDLPQISGGSFYWYVFVLPGPDARYHLCAAHRMRDWAVGFDAPLGRTFHDKLRWRSDLHRIESSDAALFRWGDEERQAVIGRPDRIVELDNAVAELAATGQPGTERGISIPGPGGRAGGESQAHLLLKQYIAAHPELLGLSAQAVPRVEYRFATGDRVDVLFENHRPDRTVVEVEISGEDNLLVGVQQALKYQTLAGVEAGWPVLSHRVRAQVVAYETSYPRVEELARQYGVALLQVKPALVLAS